ncbi:MAG: ketoacyl-ACP synthase III, partial [candidate division Zixibacteria bacterium]|nr:ketoacyl-ACP synthase III [candidate division Zixibacteria bacterium]
DTSDEWIVTRTGIRERHVVGDSGEATSDMCTNAARMALADAGMSAEELDLIIIGTVTPDMKTPSAAIFVQEKLGAVNAAAMDVNAACVGFLYSLATARAFILSGMYRNILALGSETLTSITNYQDRTTCVLFGDGAGGAIVTRSEQPDIGILSTHLAAAGQHHALLYVGVGGSRQAVTLDNINNGARYLQMNGSEIFKLAVKSMADASHKVLEKANIKLEEVDLLVPHQANIRIINSLGKRLKFPEEKVFVNIDRYGNTSSASIPIALTDARAQGKLKPGDLALLVSFGGGLVWGAALIRC